jgi:hypothetical protein
VLDFLLLTKPKIFIKGGVVENCIERVIVVVVMMQSCNSCMPLGILMSVHPSLLSCAMQFFVVDLSFIRSSKLVVEAVSIELCCCSLRDVPMRVVAQGLPPATTNVDKVCFFLDVCEFDIYVGVSML